MGSCRVTVVQWHLFFPFVLPVKNEVPVLWLGVWGSDGETECGFIQRRGSIDGALSGVS